MCVCVCVCVCLERERDLAVFEWVSFCYGDQSRLNVHLTPLSGEMWPVFAGGIVFMLVNLD